MRLSVELGIPVGAWMKEAPLTRLLQESKELAHVVSSMQDEFGGCVTMHSSSSGCVSRRHWPANRSGGGAFGAPGRRVF